MKNLCYVATLVAVATMLSISAGQAVAQSAPPAAAAPRAQGSGGVAVIDVGYIFRNHARFKQAMENMKKDYEKADGDLKAEAAGITKSAEKLKSFAIGTPDYKALEEELTRRKSSLQTSAELIKKRLMEQEAKIYYNVYREIQDEVQQFCRRYDIVLVLNHSSEPIDPQRPESVRAGLLRPIVYQEGGDITQKILARLNPPVVDKGGTIPPR